MHSSPLSGVTKRPAADTLRRPVDISSRSESPDCVTAPNGVPLATTDRSALHIPPLAAPFGRTLPSGAPMLLTWWIDQPPGRRSGHIMISDPGTAEVAALFFPSRAATGCWSSAALRVRPPGRPRPDAQGPADRDRPGLMPAALANAAPAPAALIGLAGRKLSPAHTRFALSSSTSTRWPPSSPAPGTEPSLLSPRPPAYPSPPGSWRPSNGRGDQGPGEGSLMSTWRPTCWLTPSAQTRRAS